MNFEGKEQIFSKRCQCPPGGQSNFKFLYDDAQPDKCNFKKHPDDPDVIILKTKDDSFSPDSKVLSFEKKPRK